MSANLSGCQFNEITVIILTFLTTILIYEAWHFGSRVNCGWFVFFYVFLFNVRSIRFDIYSWKFHLTVIVGLVAGGTEKIMMIMHKIVYSHLCNWHKLPLERKGICISPTQFIWSTTGTTYPISHNNNLTRNAESHSTINNFKFLTQSAPCEWCGQDMAEPFSSITYGGSKSEMIDGCIILCHAS